MRQQRERQLAIHGHRGLDRERTCTATPTVSLSQVRALRCCVEVNKERGCAGALLHLNLALGLAPGAGCRGVPWLPHRLGAHWSVSTNKRQQFGTGTAAPELGRLHGALWGPSSTTCAAMLQRVPNPQRNTNTPQPGPEGLSDTAVLAPHQTPSPVPASAGTTHTSPLHRRKPGPVPRCSLPRW